MGVLQNNKSFPSGDHLFVVCENTTLKQDVPRWGTDFVFYTIPIAALALAMGYKKMSNKQSADLELCD